MDPGTLTDSGLHQSLYLLKYYFDIISLSPQMNSLGSSSKWPSFDSIPSNSSFLHSESEQTEDETDAFSEGEVDSGITKPLSADEGLSLSGLYLQLAHLYPPHLKSRSDKPSQWPDRTQQTLTATSPGASTSFSSTTVTPGDLIFAQKVSPFDWFSIFRLTNTKQVVGISLVFPLVSLVCKSAPIYPSFASPSTWTQDWAIWQRYQTWSFQV